MVLRRSGCRLRRGLGALLAGQWHPAARGDLPCRDAGPDSRRAAGAHLRRSAHPTRPTWRSVATGRLAARLGGPGRRPGQRRCRLDHVPARRPRPSARERSAHHRDGVHLGARRGDRLARLPVADAACSRWLLVGQPVGGPDLVGLPPPSHSARLVRLGVRAGRVHGGDSRLHSLRRRAHRPGTSRVAQHPGSRRLERPGRHEFRCFRRVRAGSSLCRQRRPGEFGWLAAAAMAVLGVLLAWWHVTHPPSSDGPADSARSQPGPRVWAPNPPLGDVGL